MLEVRWAEACGLMPFTPFHMGPALALKSITGRHFSILMFGLAQVAMDIEPGVGMLRDADVLHGWSHTYLGATVIAALVLALGRPLCFLILRRCNEELLHHRLGRLAEPDTFGWRPAAAGAFIGTYSHVALDSIMHADMQPLAPFSSANHLLSVISIDALHIACVVAGIVGVGIWLLAGTLTRKNR